MLTKNLMNKNKNDMQVSIDKADNNFYEQFNAIVDSCHNSLQPNVYLYRDAD